MDHRVRLKVDPNASTRLSCTAMYRHPSRWPWPCSFFLRKVAIDGSVELSSCATQIELASYRARWRSVRCSPGQIDTGWTSRQRGMQPGFAVIEVIVTPGQWVGRRRGSLAMKLLRVITLGVRAWRHALAARKEERDTDTHAAQGRCWRCSGARTGCCQLPMQVY